MTPITRAQILTTARSYLGTPFHHQGRVKRVGVDCIGLLCGVAQELNQTFHDYQGYARYPDGMTLLRELDKCLVAIANPVVDLRPGDVATFWVRKRGAAQHAAIISDHGMIHTWADIGRVVEHGFDARWGERLMRCYRFPGVVADDTPPIVWPEVPPPPQFPVGFKPGSEGPCCH